MPRKRVSDVWGADARYAEIEGAARAALGVPDGAPVAPDAVVARLAADRAGTEPGRWHYNRRAVEAVLAARGDAAAALETLRALPPSGPTRDEGHRRAYAKAEAAVRRSLGLRDGAPVDPARIVDDLLARRAAARREPWHYERAAVEAVLAGRRDDGAAQAALARLRAAPPSGPQRAEVTLRAYERQYANLEKQVRRAMGMAPHAPVAPHWVVDHVVDKRARLKKNAYRFQKAAVEHHLVGLLSASGDSEADRETAGRLLERLRSEPQTEALSEARPRAGEVTTAKRLPDADFRRLVDEIGRSKSGYRDLLALWLSAGRKIGLRPCEWGHARFVEAHPETGGPVLEVRNAKRSNGRAHGDFRHIRLDAFDAPTVTDVRQLAGVLSRLAAESEKAARGDTHNARGEPRITFERVRWACEKVLRRANQNLWPRRAHTYSLYSARHQFSADAKQAHDPVGVAALMGHCVDITATEYYGRKRNARGGFVVEPLPSEVARVRARSGVRPPWKARDAAPDPAQPPAPRGAP